MARIVLAPEVADDFERILEHLEQCESPRVETVVDTIIDAIDVLERNPLIGRPGVGGNRELVIGSGSTGYVALYRYVQASDLVVVLAVRGQREAGFARG